MQIHFEEPPFMDDGRHELNPQTSLSLPLDAPALETTQDQDGNSEEILARLRSLSEYGDSYKDTQPSAELLVIRRIDGKLHFRAVDQYKHPLAEVPVKPRYRNKPAPVKTNTGAPDVDVRFTRPKHKKGAPLLHISMPLMSRGRMQVTTAPEAATEQPTATIHHTVVEQNKQRKGRRIRRWLAGLALVHTANTSGGGIDMAMDAFSDAKTVVEQEFPVYPGIPPDEKRAVGEVARTMQDLDDGNYGAIEARAAAFKEQNKDQFLPDAELKTFQSRIETARSHDEVIKVVNEFMHFYDKSAGAQSAGIKDVDAFSPDNIELKTFQKQALGVIDAYSFLPKKYVEKSDFDHLAFSGMIHGEDFEPGGHYDPTDKTIRIVSVGHLEDVINDVRDDAEDLTHHETAHAEDKELRNEHSKDAGLFDVAGYAVRWIIESPKDVSTYAAANRGTHNEPYAENAAGILSGENNMLAHPNDARRFSSDANKQLLAHLIDLDKEFPGFSDYVVVHGEVAKRSGPWPITLAKKIF